MVVCGVVLVVACVVWCCSCRVFVCVTCFSSHRLGLYRVVLHVEYAERRINYGILFIFSPFYEYRTLNVNMVLSNTGFTRRNTVFLFVWLRLRNT